MSYRTPLAIEWSFGDAFDALLSHPYPLPPYHSARSDISIVFYRLQKMYMSELACRTQTTIPRRPLAFIPSRDVFSDDLKKHQLDLDHFFTLLDVIEVNEPNYRTDRQIMEIVNRELPRTQTVLRLIEKIIKNDLSPPPTLNLGQLIRPVSLLSSTDDINEFTSLFTSIPTPIGPPNKKEVKNEIDLEMLNSMVQSLGGWKSARKAIGSHQSGGSSSPSMSSSDSGRSTSASSSSLTSTDSSDTDDSTDLRALFLATVASKIAADPKSEEWRARVKQSEQDAKEKRRIADEKKRKRMAESRPIPSKKGESDEEKEYRLTMEGKMKKWEKKRDQERMEEAFRKNQEELAKKKEEENRIALEKIRARREAKKNKKVEKKRKSSKKCLASSSSSSDESNTSQSDEVVTVQPVAENAVETEVVEQPLQQSFIPTVVDARSGLILQLIIFVIIIVGAHFFM